MPPRSTVNSNFPNSTAMEEFLKRNPSTCAIQVLWPSYSGALFAKLIPVEHCRQLALEKAPLCSETSSIAGIVPAALVNNLLLESQSKLELMPDYGTLRKISSKRAAVLCNVKEDVDLKKGLKLQDGFERCTRSALRRVIAAADGVGIQVRVGFEVEFYLVRLDDLGPERSWTSSLSISTQGHTRPWSSAWALDLLPYGDCIDTCLGTLHEARIKVQCYHAEMSPGQYEIVLDHLPALDAVDTVLITKQIIRRCAQAHGFRAVFQPMPFDGAAPTGLHAHLSIHQAETDNDGGKIPQNFLAGMLYRLPALCAFTMASLESYDRRMWNQGGVVATGANVAWGTDNKQVPINQIAAGHWEIRTLDWTANLYLAISSFVSSGLLGVQDSLPLLWGDASLIGGTTGENNKALPKSLQEAIVHLTEEGIWLGEYMGDSVVRLYLTVRIAETAYMLQQLSDEEREELCRAHF
ncbi:glutamine synthetase/guanido kinase [Byssothecium circinans]|uniref:Glutamine synthetase/guanido kinase n=1 Tax=Byssothecium circinans TaxID=147558 RepID=A0A6A5TB99_9PLEO|nr:glutamine synthetase/guanido kinase [Byssothecium circinans]